MIHTIISIVLGVSNAHAKLPTDISQSCSQLLVKSANSSVLDYEMSDLEASFFAYVEKLVKAREVEPSRLEYFLKDILNMKASLLNDVGSLLPFVLTQNMDEERRSQMIGSIFQIVDTLGVPGEVYGLKVDENGQVTSPLSKARDKNNKVGNNKVAQIEIAREKTAIGFLGGAAPVRDLPAHLHRSIGFAKPEVRGENPPARSVGNIRRAFADKKQEVVAILDGENNMTYLLPLSSSQLSSFTLNGKKYALEFSAEIRGWVVKVENLNNPSGRIGF